MVLLHMRIKVLKHPIEVHARSPIESLLLLELPVPRNVLQDTSLAVELSLLFSLFHHK